MLHATDAVDAALLLLRPRRRVCVSFLVHLRPETLVPEGEERLVATEGAG